MSRMLRCVMPMLVLILLAGCSAPKPPEKERPVEPQATELRDAIQQPIDRAKKAGEQIEDAAQAQRDAIEAAESGN
ncbi:hypothetical protein [Lysobacter panacisoli]|nr:hypothetical protein [Lysobacter panacisoli]